MKYFIYCRKSTEEEDRQIQSIEAQEVELREFAAKEKLEIVASFKEAKTAKEPGRIVFAEMLSRIEQGEAQGILSWHPDRLARNSVDGGRIIYMIDRKLVQSLKFCTFWFEPTPQGLFMLQIAFGQSKYYVNSLRENVKRGLRQKIRNGVWPGRAVVGYLNNPKTRGIDVDRDKAPKVHKLFELYATGNETMYSLARSCKANGLQSVVGKDIAVSKVYSILSNPFYIGLMKFNGELFQGTHEPIVEKSLFDTVQKILHDRGRPQKDNTHQFSFLGMMKCASCGCSITAETQKGHTYYRCTKKKTNCTEKYYLREENLLEQLREYLQSIAYPRETVEKFLKFLNTHIDRAKDQSKSEVESLKSHISKIDRQLEKLLDGYLSEVISKDELRLRKQKMLNQKLDLQEKLRDFEERGFSWLEPARAFALSLNKAQKLLSTTDYAGWTTFLKNIGSNHILRNRRLEFSLVKPYDLLPRGGSGAARTFDFFSILTRAGLEPATRCLRGSCSTIELSGQASREPFKRSTIACPPK